MPVSVFLWKANEEDFELAKTIMAVIQTYTDVELNIKIDDLSTVEATDIDSPCVAFGHMANKQYNCTSINWVLPEISKLRSDPDNKLIREEAFERMGEICQQLTAVAEQKEEETNSHVEMSDGVTVGKVGTDFCISEQEVQYLKQLKELLNGSKIIITKGDIKIEVE